MRVLGDLFDSDLDVLADTVDADHIRTFHVAKCPKADGRTLGTKPLDERLDVRVMEADAFPSVNGIIQSVGTEGHHVREGETIVAIVTGTSLACFSKAGW